MEIINICAFTYQSVRRNQKEAAEKRIEEEEQRTMLQTSLRVAAGELHHIKVHSIILLSCSQAVSEARGVLLSHVVAADATRLSADT